ncbi:MAG: hypothetical protein AW07_00124 [Candidatus Accumulibacter sp. SK-11]|nr:MAG: hypothetical protein AW07_00124 [Candidatus Accumulibacter sp. SK-11]
MPTSGQTGHQEDEQRQAESEIGHAREGDHHRIEGQSEGDQGQQKRGPALGPPAHPQRERPRDEENAVDHLTAQMHLRRRTGNPEAPREVQPTGHKTPDVLRRDEVGKETTLPKDEDSETDQGQDEALAQAQLGFRPVGSHLYGEEWREDQSPQRAFRHAQRVPAGEIAAPGVGIPLRQRQQSTHQANGQREGEEPERPEASPSHLAAGSRVLSGDHGRARQDRQQGVLLVEEKAPRPGAQVDARQHGG